MDNTTKRINLKNIIVELSKQIDMSEDYCEATLERLKEIYSDEFRHTYSDITSLLLDMNSKNNSENDSMISIDRLGENMRTLNEFSNQDSEFPYLAELTKLNDHITMDLSRIKVWNKLIAENKLTYENMRETNQKMNELNIKMEKTTKDMNSARSKINIASRESQNTKKDLVSIMAIFMAVFSFIQWNFSQFKDLLEYDPFNRLVYILSVDGILILSLYCIFAMVDFIIHKDPRMIKPFLNISTKKPTCFGIITLGISILILMGCLYSLKSDTSRKTISKIENSIEETNENLNHEIKKKNVEINILKEKITELENQIKEINKNDIKLEENTKIKQD